MRHRRYAIGCMVGAACMLTSAMALAQGAQPSEDQSVESTKPEPAKPVRKPKYLDLRYDEDFSYLDGPADTYEADFFDPIKNMHLGDDLTLSIGGEFRFRWEAETDLGFGGRMPSADTIQLYRYFLHFDLKYHDVARAFVQVASIHDEGRDLPLRPLDENLFTLHQGLLDLTPMPDRFPITLRVGRQELRYGKERFVSPLRWANARRRFDGIKLFYKADDWQADVFWVRPTIVSRNRADSWNDNFDFWGGYFTCSAVERHTFDVFVFGTHDNRNRLNPNGNAGEKNLYMLGGRLGGKTAGFDYEGMISGQWGDWAGDSIRAWAWTAAAGYTFDMTWKPRLGAQFEWASGDASPTDSTVGTFDQLFPLGHAYFGLIDLMSRQNIKDLNINLTAWPVKKKVKSQIAWHTFWLQQTRDAQYNLGGAPNRRDVTGGSGRELGQEVDVTLLWKIDHHQSVLLGFSQFFAGDFMQNTGPSDDPNLFYAQYIFKF